MCNIYLCLAKLILTISFEGNLEHRDDRYVCELVHFGDYYGIDISAAIPQEVINFVTTRPEIVQVQFSPVYGNPDTMLTDFKFYDISNKSHHRIVSHYHKEFDPKKDMIGKVNSSFCQKNNYWLFLNYAKFIDYEPGNNIISPIMDIGGFQLIDFNDQKFVIVKENGLTIIPKINFISKMGPITVYNHQLHNYVLAENLEIIWSRFLKKYQTPIQIVSYR